MLHRLSKSAFPSSTTFLKSVVSYVLREYKSNMFAAIFAWESEADLKSSNIGTTFPICTFVTGQLERLYPDFVWDEKPLSFFK